MFGLTISSGFGGQRSETLDSHLPSTAVNNNPPSGVGASVRGRSTTMSAVSTATQSASGVTTRETDQPYGKKSRWDWKRNTWQTVCFRSSVLTRWRGGIASWCCDFHIWSGCRGSGDIKQYACASSLLMFFGICSYTSHGTSSRLRCNCVGSLRWLRGRGWGIHG